MWDISVTWPRFIIWKKKSDLINSSFAYEDRWDSTSGSKWLYPPYTCWDDKTGHRTCYAGARFWYIIFQISRDLIPAAYKNEKKLVDFPRLTPSVTCIGRIRALWPTRSILTILICKWAKSERDIWESVPETGPRGAFLVRDFPDAPWPNSWRLRKWKILVDFPRLTPSLTCIGRIPALWPTR